MNEKIEKHLKPHQLALQQKYTDARTQMPVQNMSYKDKAPFISIIGPRDSGKDKLFDLLVTTLTKKSNIQIDNIITIANSQNKITLYKSQEKLSSYIDAVKISDLVILSIDANNIKIDTFEIISLLKAHGMCKVIVAVDNADRKNLKVVKKRVWKEITPGIKIYNIDIKSDIEKMAREIKNMKFRPLQFRCNNSYVIADKIQYEAENDKYNYYFYGYIRGCPMRTNNIHIPGNGDYEIAEKEILDDPCSILTKKLLEKEKRNFYAPKYKEQIIVSDIIENDVQEEESSEEFALCNDAKIVIKQEASGENKKQETCDPIAESRETTQETNQDTLDDLLNIIADKFEAKAETEEDYIEKFNEQTKDKVEITKRDERLQQEKKNNDLVSDFVPGQYVKITLRGIDELIIGNLAILGAINFTTKTVLQGRVKKLNHFIHSLKSNEKYLISLGLRRDVCVNIFSYKDPTRNKFLKYILDDAHCNINFESNVIDPGTTFCIIKENQMIKDEKHNNYRATDNVFRIAAQGTITDASGKTNLVKKLKLIGYPLKIDEHTVFVNDMFSSDKEVAKFEGAMLKTVGGIRGSVKKSVGHNGDFRATFEGRLLMSDIIMLKCYVPYTYQDHGQTTAEPKKKKVITSAKNVAEMIENKKDRKHAYKMKQIEKNLIIDKKKIVADFAMPQIPIDSAQKNYNKLKDKIKEKRLALEDREIKKLKAEAERLEKERTQHDKEKKEKLKKTIIEKNLFKPGKSAHKQHKKKSKRRK